MEILGTFIMDAEIIGISALMVKSNSNGIGSVLDFTVYTRSNSMVFNYNTFDRSDAEINGFQMDYVRTYEEVLRLTGCAPGPMFSKLCASVRRRWSELNKYNFTEDEQGNTGRDSTGQGAANTGTGAGAEGGENAAENAPQRQPPQGPTMGGGRFA